MPELLYAPHVWLYVVGVACLAAAYYCEAAARWWTGYYRHNVDSVPLRSKGLHNIRIFDFLAFLLCVCGAALFFTAI